MSQEVSRRMLVIFDPLFGRRVCSERCNPAIKELRLRTLAQPSHKPSRNADSTSSFQTRGVLSFTPFSEVFPLPFFAIKEVIIAGGCGGCR